MQSYVSELVCVACGRKYPPGAVADTCPDCGPDDGILDIHYDLERVAEAWRARPLAERPLNLWRYRELLPLVNEESGEAWAVGWTPIIDARRMASELSVAQVLLKDESRTLTASFKDRASAVAVAHAMEQGAHTVACSSTGNAATSLAGFSALAGLDAVIFVPRTAPEPKLAQLLMYGATVMAVDGTYDEAYRLCSSACAAYGWYNRNCAINPVLVEGKKTGGLEIAEQCVQAGGVPDWVVVSVGDGCTIAGIWKGLCEIRALGVIDRLPRLLGVQARTVAPIVYALEHGELPGVEDSAGTIADSIDVAAPRNWRKAVRAIRESDGILLTVADKEIMDAMRVAGGHGMFSEPAASAAVAGLRAACASGMIRRDDRVLALMTGGGLKDTQAALRSAGSPISVEPTMEALAKALPAQ